MGDPKGFLTLRRAGPARQPVDRRISHFQEFYEPMAAGDVASQGARCMDCGVPFCQGDTGCPVQNLIPEWNELVHRGRWREASEVLHSTNNFPELTGRLCPAPCESACVLGLINDPVSIRTVEQAIVDRAFAEGWIAPRPPVRESGRKVAVVGSGPAGLAAAQQLRRLGHSVTVFEKSDRVGGLLRYGIPDFKLEKTVLDRRLAQMIADGVEFRTNVAVGADFGAAELREQFDAVLLATGAPIPRDLDVAGRALPGIHFAMDLLEQQNRRIAGDAIDGEAIHARGKRVVIIGGGDTGSDCAGVCVRQGAASVTQFELLPRPPIERASSTPWPAWPMQLRSSHAHEEGATRDWEITTTAFSGHGRVERLHAARVTASTREDGSVEYVPGPERLEVAAELVLLAMGFQGAGVDTLARSLGVVCDARGNVITTEYRTNVPGVYAAGDRKRGASLIVWAIREGRDAAAAMHRERLS